MSDEAKPGAEPGAGPESAWDWNGVMAEERAWCASWARVAWTAAEWPRRLGGDANGAELRSDKRTGHRVAHVLLNGMASWGGRRLTFNDMPEQVLSEAEKQAAAIMVWAEWIPDTVVQLTVRKDALVAAAQAAGDAKAEKAIRHRSRLMIDFLRLISVEL